MTPAASPWAMERADEIVVSEGLAPSAERDLVDKIALALDAAALHGAERMREAAARLCEDLADKRDPRYALDGGERFADAVRHLDPARVLAGEETP